MAEEKAEWTQSQITAFPYIQKAVSDGLTATESLSQYREGGGAIRDALWYSLFREEFSYSGVRDKIVQIPSSYIVPESMFEEVAYDYREEYVIQMEVKGYSAELKQEISKWITVESPELLTKQEWIALGQETIYSTIGSPDLTIDSVLQWIPLRKTGEIEW